MEPIERPPPEQRARRGPLRRAKVAIGALVLVGALATWGVTTVFAASPSPSASGSPGASASPGTGTHQCDKATQSASPSSS
jgi:hypothetical protein